MSQEATLEMAKQTLQQCRRHTNSEDFQSAVSVKQFGEKADTYRWWDDDHKFGGRDIAYGYFRKSAQLVEFFATKTTSCTIFKGTDALALKDVFATCTRDDI